MVTKTKLKRGAADRFWAHVDDIGAALQAAAATRDSDEALAQYKRLRG